MMCEQFDARSELVEISKLNGSFRRNYGKLIGGYLYLRSINAIRGRSRLSSGLFFAAVSIGLVWLEKGGFLWLPAG